MITVESLSAARIQAAEAGLVTLLRDVVDGGASVGFLPPLVSAEASAYWKSVAAAVAEGRRVALIACIGEVIAGSGQLDLEMRPNGRHRAEVMKVMVHRAHRRRGLGRAIMQALEDEARRHGRTTLVLDTRQGDPSELLYASLGWRFAGAIPRYARSADGPLDATAFYYKLLDHEPLAEEDAQGSLFGR